MRTRAAFVALLLALSAAADDGFSGASSTIKVHSNKFSLLRVMEKSLQGTAGVVRSVGDALAVGTGGTIRALGGSIQQMGGGLEGLGDAVSGSSEHTRDDDPDIETSAALRSIASRPIRVVGRALRAVGDTTNFLGDTTERVASEVIVSFRTRCVSSNLQCAPSGRRLTGTTSMKVIECVLRTRRRAGVAAGLKLVVVSTHLTP